VESSGSDFGAIRSGPDGDEQAFVVRIHFAAADPASVIERAREVNDNRSDLQPQVTRFDLRHWYSHA